MELRNQKDFPLMLSKFYLTVFMFQNILLCELFHANKENNS